MSADRTATTYLQIQKGRYTYEAKVVNATQRKPSVLAPDCILVKIKVRVPAAAFDPFEPSAEVIIPADLIQHEVTVEAGDPA